MAWTYLTVAGLFEIGWPIGLKWAQEAQGLRGTVVGVVVAVVSMAVSGTLLYLAQREIALGTSYAVWTGIGAAGTFLIGVWFFGDPNGLGPLVRRRTHRRRGSYAQARALKRAPIRCVRFNRRRTS
jgi:quaternary ammonium compound-resistance protein SugE